MVVAVSVDYPHSARWQHVIATHNSWDYYWFWIVFQQVALSQIWV